MPNRLENSLSWWSGRCGLGYSVKPLKHSYVTLFWHGVGSFYLLPHYTMMFLPFCQPTNKKKKKIKFKKKNKNNVFFNSKGKKNCASVIQLL